MSVLNTHRIAVGEKFDTQFKRAEGIRSDGTLATYRDVDGKLWAMAGHTNSGHIGMFCGTCMADLAEVWPISLNFGDGHADYAFAGNKNLKGIVTDVFELDDIQNAMDRSVADKANIVKAVVRI